MKEKITERILLNGKDLELITLPAGLGITNNHDDTVTVSAEDQSVIENFKNKIKIAPSSRDLTRELGKRVVSASRLLENMWDEYGKIKDFRRPAVIVLECNIHFLVDALLREYGKEKTAKSFSLKHKSEYLKNEGIIDNCLCGDLWNVTIIRNYYAHNILFNKEKEKEFFETNIPKFHCLEGLRNKKIPIDAKFGKCCYRIMNKLYDKYMEKIERK